MRMDPSSAPVMASSRVLCSARQVMAAGGGCGDSRPQSVCVCDMFMCVHAHVCVCMCVCVATHMTCVCVCVCVRVCATHMTAAWDRSAFKHQECARSSSRSSSSSSSGILARLRDRVV